MRPSRGKDCANRASSTSEMSAQLLESPKIEGSGYLDAAARLLRPSFLERVREGSHRDAIAVAGLEYLAGPAVTVETFLSRVYDRIVEDYPCEYVYKNEFIRQRFAPNFAPSDVIISELPILDLTGRVDLVHVGQCTTSYEIKTEFDSLQRLRRQVENNLRLFDRNYVVCSPRFEAVVKDAVGPNVGVLVFTDDRRFRKAGNARNNVKNIDPAAVFDSIQLADAERALEAAFSSLPRSTSLEKRNVYLDLFRQLPRAVVRDVFQKKLRKGRRRPWSLEDSPYGLAQLQCQTKPSERARLLDPSVLARPTG